MADWSQAKTGHDKISDSDRSFDYDFWRGQSAAVKMAAIWQMIVFHQQVKNRDPNELRLDRTFDGFRKKTALDISSSAGIRPWGARSTNATSRR